MFVMCLSHLKFSNVIQHFLLIIRGSETLSRDET